MLRALSPPEYDDAIGSTAVIEFKDDKTVLINELQPSNAISIGAVGHSYNSRQQIVKSFCPLDQQYKRCLNEQRVFPGLPLDSERDILNTFLPAERYTDEWHVALKKGKAPDLPYPVFFAEPCHNVSFELLFRPTRPLKDPRVSTLIESKANFHPIEMEISGEDLKQRFGNVFDFKMSHQVLPIRIDLEHFESKLGIPVLVSLQSVKSNEISSRVWTRQNTVMSWDAPGGAAGSTGIFVPASGLKETEAMFQSDLAMVHDQDFRRLMHFDIPEVRKQLQSLLSPDEGYYHLKAPPGSSKQVDPLLWVVTRHLHDVLGTMAKQLTAQYGSDYTGDRLFTSVEGGYLRVPVPVMNALLGIVEQRQDADHHLMRLDKPIRMCIYPAHPDGWGAVRTRQSESLASTGGLMTVADPLADICARVKMYVLPNWFMDKWKFRSMMDPRLVKNCM